MSKDSRSRMVRSAAQLIRTRGFNAASFSEVVAASGAPRGSIYHHFPRGKEQLAEDAIRWTSDRALKYQRSCPAKTPARVLEWFVDMWRQIVVASGGAEGCVVAGVAVDSGSDDELIGLVRETFRVWVDLLAEQLAATGLARRRARPVAMAAVAGMEGALILCRAEGGSAPLETVAAELKRLVLPVTRGVSGRDV
jgi:TetR/AcrR family transcriptional regulator, lmrAB and yxaGH operons repressor